MTDPVARVASGVADLPRDQWDACAGDANPFVCWDFLTALERSVSYTHLTLPTKLEV